MGFSRAEGGALNCFIQLYFGTRYIVLVVFFLFLFMALVNM